MGDGRIYEYVVGLRAVTSTDGMTADFTATRIINEVKREWVDPTGRAMGFAGPTHRSTGPPQRENVN